jgi:hypothetical protein
MCAESGHHLGRSAFSCLFRRFRAFFFQVVQRGSSWRSACRSLSRRTQIEHHVDIRRDVRNSLRQRPVLEAHRLVELERRNEA